MTRASVAADLTQSLFAHPSQRNELAEKQAVNAGRRAKNVWQAWPYCTPRQAHAQQRDDCRARHIEGEMDAYVDARPRDGQAE
ncbi:MAG TPA: hypothetical protein VL424_05640, partial [Pararobbsia sp.]|nr:hypothetical protein [Pararobbsia sp.]